MGLARLFDFVEAHDECWVDNTHDAQHYEFTIEHQQSGADIRRIGGRDYATESGDLSIFAAGTIVETERICQAPLRVQYLRLRGSLAAEMEQALGVRQHDPLILHQPPVRLIVVFAQTMKRVFDRQPGWPWGVVGALAEMTRILTVSCPERSGSCSSARLADRIRLLVEETSDRDWSVKELADLFGVRRAAIWKAFKDQTGQSPASWIRAHRIHVAQRMLARGLSVRETAESMGFSSRQHLARAFKAVTGHPPSVR